MEQPISKMKKGYISFLFSTPTIQKKALEIFQDFKLAAPKFTTRDYVVFVENHKNDTLEDLEHLRSKLDNAVDEDGNKIQSLLMDAGVKNDGSFWFKFTDRHRKFEGRKRIQEYYSTQEKVDIHERPTIKTMADMNKCILEKGSGAFSFISRSATNFGLSRLNDLNYDNHKRSEGIKRSYKVFAHSVLRVAILLGGANQLTSNQKDRCWDWLNQCKEIAGDKSPELEIQARYRNLKLKHARNTYKPLLSYQASLKLASNPSSLQYHRHNDDHRRYVPELQGKHSSERSRPGNFFLDLLRQHRDSHLPTKRWNNEPRSQHCARDLPPPREVPQFVGKWSHPRHAEKRRKTRPTNISSVPGHNIETFIHHNVSDISSSRQFFSNANPSLLPQLKEERVVQGFT